MKVALVYDRVNKWGGAERVLLALHEIWPDAPLFTSVYNPKGAPWAEVFQVVPSFLQNLPLVKLNHEFFPFLMPIAFESLNFDEYDVVISVSSEAAKGVITKPKTLHLCYCLTPTRYLWSGYMDYFDKFWKRSASRFLVAYLRRWDKIAAQRPNCFVAISKTVQKRIRNYYHCESEVIYPPVDIQKFKVKNLESRNRNEKFYLVVSRLVRYKKIELVVEAFNQLNLNLKIVGTGRQLTYLKKIAKRNNIEFLGELTDDQLLSYYQNCEAVLFPQEEDFGLVPVEAMACGKPVIAFGRGGATETVIKGVTGDFFYPQTVEGLKNKVLSYEGRFGERFRPKSCLKQAEKFSKERFKKEFREFVEKKWEIHTKTISTR